MTAKEAYDKAVKKMNVKLGNDDAQFTLLGWDGDDIGFDGCKEGPFLIHIDGEVAIQVTREGVFHSSFPAKAKGYYPYIEV